MVRSRNGRNGTAPAQMIDAQGLELLFAEDSGIHDLSLQVPEGTIFGLIGPSGSGKTTLVRLMTGVRHPTKGKLRVLGQSPSHFSTRTRERIGYLPQQFMLYPNLTVWENLNFMASLYGMGYFRRRRRLNSLLELVELGTVRNRLGNQLSGGMQRRLSLACALVHNPALIFADEPTAGIDPVLRGKFWEYFRDLRNEGRTLFVTTQYVGEAAYCDLVGVMSNGRLIHVDTPQGLRRTALGGEVIKLVVDQAHLIDTAQLLMEQPNIHDVRRSQREPGLLYIYVDRAGEALPQIFTTLNAHPDISVQVAEEYQPPFDDIFVRLMEQSGNGRVQTIY